MAQRNVLTEYLIALGANVDERSFRQFQQQLNRAQSAVQKTVKAMDGVIKGTKVYAAVLTTAVVGLGKFSLSLHDTANRYEDMAKAQKKSVNEIVAQEYALKAMGKTLDEVNKNDRLKKTYEQLVLIGEKTGLPATGKGRQMLSDFLLEFDRAKVVSMSLMQHINAVFLEKIARPLKDLRDTVRDMREKIMLNMPKISSVVGTGLSYIVRLFSAGVRGIGDLISLFQSLPDVIKRTALGFGGLWAVMKASPITWIMAGLTALLLLLDDFYVHKQGGKTLLGDLWAGLETGNIGDTVLGKIQDGLGGLTEKIKGMFDIGTSVAEAITDSLINYDFADDGVKIGGFINNLFSKMSDLLSGDGGNIADLISGWTKTVLALAQGLIRSIAGAVSTIDYKTAGNAIGDFVGKLFGKIGELLTGEDVSLANIISDGLQIAKDLGEGVFKLLTSALNTVDFKAVGAMLGDFVVKIFEGVTELFKPDEMGELTVTITNAVEGLIVAVVEFVAGFGEKLVTGITDLFITKGALERFVATGIEIGKAIIKGVWQSIGYLGVELIFGEEEADKLKKQRAKEDAEKLRKEEDKKFTKSLYEEGAIGKDDEGNIVHAGQLAAVVQTQGRDVAQAMIDAASDKETQDLHTAKQYAQALIMTLNNEGWLKNMSAEEKAQLFELFKSYIEASKVEEGKVVDAQEVLNAVEAIKNFVFGLNVDTKDLEQQINQKLQEMNPTLKVNVELSTDERSDTNAAGGRYTRPRLTTVSESGQTEYIIPINKPERAQGLILQMLGEMGSRAKGVLSRIGVQGGASGLAPKLAYAGAVTSANHSYAGGSSSIKSNSDNSFDAKTTINVYGTGDPQSAGQAAARANEAVLMRHIKGVFDNA